MKTFRAAIVTLVTATLAATSALAQYPADYTGSEEEAETAASEPVEALPSDPPPDSTENAKESEDEERPGA